MSIQLLKLSNGETVMTDVVEVIDKIVTVLNPLEIRYETRGGRTTMLALQWLPLDENYNIMHIRESHIVGMSKASEYMVDYYNEAVQRFLFPEDAERKEREDEFAEQMLEVMSGANTSINYH
jgi:hypothetical protein